MRAGGAGYAGRDRPTLRDVASGGELYGVGGVCREVARPARQVLAWVWKSDSMAGVETLATLELHERDGGAEPRLTHRGFPRPEARD